MAGRRQVGQLAPFDLVLLLVLSNAVQNSTNGSGPGQAQIRLAAAEASAASSPSPNVRSSP